ncbi:MAG: hypothetical protein ACI4QR_03525, partial [Eubacteriales bacterium]
MMKKTIKIFSALLAMLFALSFLASCKKSPGLYTWYGKKVKVENVLRLTLDMGSGEKENTVPFSLYRALFLHYSSLVPDTTVENGYEKKTSDEEKTEVAKEITEDELIGYFAVIEAARALGVDVDLINSKKYADAYREEMKKRVPEDYNATDEEYAEATLSSMLDSLGMSEEYFEYSCRRSDFEAALRLAIAPDIAEYTAGNYMHVKQYAVKFDVFDAAGEALARARAEEIIKALDSGEDADALISGYSGDAYCEEVYFDNSGYIVSSSDGKRVSELVMNTAKALSCGEHSGIMTVSSSGSG